MLIDFSIYLMMTRIFKAVLKKRKLPSCAINRTILNVDYVVDLLTLVYICPLQNTAYDVYNVFFRIVINFCIVNLQLFW